MHEPTHKSHQNNDFTTKSPLFLSMLSNIIFFSRWFQAPLYFGLILAQIFYVVQFMKELWHLSHEIIFSNIKEQEIMLMVLGLIDVVMIANLLIMVIIGGYETFVSKLGKESHRDHPEWLGEVNANTMKIKFSMALIGISSIHLLKTFINTSNVTQAEIISQIAIHMTFVFSTLLMAYTAKIMHDLH